MKTYLLGLLSIIAGSAAHAAPANDNFDSRIALSGDTVSTTDSNASATTEPAEPPYSGTHTLWWTYRPSTTGRLTISTVGSNFSEHQVAVYLGASLTDLRLVSGESSTYQKSLSFSFPVTAGADYQISFGGTPGWTGTGTLVVSLALDKNADVSSLNVPNPATMSNDNFANRLALVGNSASAICYNTSATTEAAEPAYSGNHTFWWTYRPTATGRLTISTTGTDFTEHQVAVYQGTSLIDLRLVAGEYSSYRSSLSFTFPVTVGTDYQISFGGTPGWTGTGTAVVSLLLNTNADVSRLNVPVAATALNDNFVDRVILAGSTVTAIGYNPDASTEAGEPNFASVGKTLWWSWTAGANGAVRFDFTGSDSNWLSSPFIDVFTGTSFVSLTKVTWTGSSAGAVTAAFQATAGQTYQIQVGSRNTSRTGSIVMTLIGPPTPPAFSTTASSKFVHVGDAIDLSALAVGGTVSYQWLKNGAVISGATSPAYHVASATLANGGAYTLKATNKFGPRLSPVANIGVVNTTTSAVIVNEAAVLKLIAPAGGPSTMAYRWRYNGGDLADSKVGTRVVSGSGTATLSISPAIATDAGAYTCHLTMVDPQNIGTPLTSDTGAFNVTVRLKPVVDANNAPLNGIASGAYAWSPSATASPTGFIITGLPTGSGLTYNPITGALTGTPNVSGSFQIKVSAKNLAGTGPVQSFTLFIGSLPTGTAGNFTGWLERQTQINGFLGGYLSLSVASTGNFTGTLKTGTVTYANFSGRLVAPLSGNPTALVSFKRTSPLTPLVLTLVFDGANNALSGNLSDGASTALISARRSIWSGTAALAYAALYNSSVDLPVGSLGDTAQPLGVGWQTMTVTAAGAASGSGRTAEGVAYTFNGSLWPDGSVPQFVLIDSNKGSVMGLPKITLGGTVPNNRVTGWVDEIKTGPISSTDHTYATGIPYMKRNLDGAPWVKPTTAFPIVMSLPDAPGNAQIVFSKGDVEAATQFNDLDQTFRINKTNIATFAATTAGNPCNVKMSSIVTASGLFGGSFTLTDTVASKPVPRLVNYSGIFLSHRGKGFGYFLLPGLTPSTTTSPILGGRLEVN